jgi:CRISPR-associated exonuclease Cas4
MSYNESEYLLLSGIQHFTFCRRQWALIHIENQWSDNLLTVEGELMHTNAHDSDFREKRGDAITVRGVNISSPTLGVSGQCDVVEYHRSDSGIPLSGYDGLWQPYPVEYKHGAPKTTDADILQLCGQAMCLEEMLCCDVRSGALFYGETRRRERVTFTDELRQRVRDSLSEMHELYRRGHTPKVKPTKSCNACSLKELCLPKLMKKRSVSEYIKNAMEEEP